MPNLAIKEYCTGCTACASACPKGCVTMMPDENGFLCPVVDEDQCVSCGLCEKTCPIVSKPELPEGEPRAYAAYSRDTALRLDSSSGGVFTELAKTVLAKGGAVFGAAYNERFEVLHICAESEADLAKLRGAKYAQSDLWDVFAQVRQRLEQGQQVLFSGTPCQVSGLKAFLRKDYDHLISVDFVCHSVPSPMAWQAYVKYRAANDNGGKLPLAINLRSKETGWSRYQYANLFRYAKDRSYVARSSDSLYMKLFVGGYINRASCASCQFKGYSRVSDVTIGDFWGVWDIAPEMDDNQGTSVVLVQSAKGAVLLDQIKGRLMIKSVTLADASRENQAMLKCAMPNERRTEVLDLIQNGKIFDCEKLFSAPAATVMTRIKRLIKKLIGK